MISAAVGRQDQVVGEGIIHVGTIGRVGGGDRVARFVKGQGKNSDRRHHATSPLRPLADCSDLFGLLIVSECEFEQGNGAVKTHKGSRCNAWSAQGCVAPFG